MAKMAAAAAVVAVAASKTNNEKKYERENQQQNENQPRSKYVYSSIPESRIFERNLQIMRMKLNSIEQIRNSSRKDRIDQRVVNNTTQKICNEIFYI